MAELVPRERPLCERHPGECRDGVSDVSGIGRTVDPPPDVVVIFLKVLWQPFKTRSDLLYRPGR